MPEFMRNAAHEYRIELADRLHAKFGVVQHRVLLRQILDVYNLGIDGETHAMPIVSPTAIRRMMAVLPRLRVPPREVAKDQHRFVLHTNVTRFKHRTHSRD